MNKDGNNTGPGSENEQRLDELNNAGDTFGNVSEEPAYDSQINTADQSTNLNPVDPNYPQHTQSSASDEEPSVSQPIESKAKTAIAMFIKAGADVQKYFLYTLITGLVVSAIISVVAVLMGEFNSTVSNALYTTGSMVAHTLFALILIAINGKSGSKGGVFIVNVLLLITVASFITTSLNIWSIITIQFTSDLYIAYGFLFFASLWVRVLLMVVNGVADKITRVASYVSIGFTVLFYILLLPTIFTHAPDKLPEFLYRAIAATVILLATSSILTVVFRRLYIHKHEAVKFESKAANEPWDILIAVIVIMLGIPYIFGILVSISEKESGSAISSKIQSSVGVKTIEESSDQNTTDKDSLIVGNKSEQVEIGGFIFTDCGELSNIDSNAFLYHYVYKFVKNDKTQNQITTRWIDNDAVMSPIRYTGTLRVLDDKCNKISQDDLEFDDIVSVYLGGSGNFYFGGLTYLQMVK